ncbi:interferon-induced, double-stranded RNA-activated protein kinase isoform X3 [Apus apus]|nr:interferon-induced, double-stranded RNA-activated protein kinase isoform X3 [Apus apus]XP_051469209.1 interferon-induced, double-stranded RNA-activated protein kinase isoform X3 [Apus apus]
MEREYMGKLNNYCQTRNLKLCYVDVNSGGLPHDPMFTVKVKIGETEYATGTGKNKKEARARAAKESWEMIERQLKNPSNMPTAKLTQCSVTLPLQGNDYVSLLNRYSQKTLELVDYPNKWTGDGHAPTFSCRCTISGVVYGTGIGPSLAVAKQAAAKQACDRLIDQGFLTIEGDESNSSSTLSKYCNSSQVLDESDSDSVCFRDSDSNLVENMKDMAVCKNTSPSQRNAQSSALKPKRKLAANFDNARKKEEKRSMSDLDESLPDLDTNTSEETENPYTVNKIFLDTFRDIELIGKGGFGNVFKATAKTDEKTYAVKRVPFINKVKREVIQLARLKHENIVEYHWSWEGDDHTTSRDSKNKIEKFLFITMELCEKGTLEDWIENNRQSQKYHEMAQDKFLQILKGVNYIHSEGLIHRDLKPQNIFISREDKIKIGDFGLVTSVDNENLTEDRGTRPYMAPEQVEASYGMKVDIFALGLIWFEILWPFNSRHERSKVWPEVRKGQFPQSFTNRFLSEASIIKKMLSGDSSGRLSASEILEILKPVPRVNSLEPNTV